MKIVIIGAGEVGYYLGALLSTHHHDVTILDRDKEALARVQEKLDVLAIEGNATSGKDLVKAGVPDADIVVAATSIDEVNMIASMMSKRLGVKKVIARVRSNELTSPDSPIKPSDLGIDVVIHPEYSVALDIVQLLKRAAASDVLNIADKKMQLVGIKLDKTCPILGKTMIEYTKELDIVKFRVVAIHRGGMTVIPKGETKLQKNDQIFVLAKTADVKAIVRSTGHNEKSLSRVMIAGGTAIGEMIAEMLMNDTRDWRIKLIEPDLDKATFLANKLHDVLVLNGNPADPDLLVTEGINDMDAFISVTNDEESNIISCLMAKHLEVRKTVALVSKPSYIPLSQTIGLDAAVNVKQSVSNEIHRYVRQGRVVSVTALHGIEAEVLELVATSNSKVINKPLSQLKFPRNVVVGGIICGDKADIAVGSTIIRENDRVIIFALPDAIDELTSCFN
ncbi:MAG: Trk system potassium transporter TrkA [Bacteroidetes bacterium]|nr:Trk system potassium transporter TrkA [Bacteroidota bacterium]NCQ11809.1 Trk system potassium transporter TrkA [Bacteroidota bacterium]